MGKKKMPKVAALDDMILGGDVSPSDLQNQFKAAEEQIKNRTSNKSKENNEDKSETGQIEEESKSKQVFNENVEESNVKESNPIAHKNKARKKIGKSDDDYTELDLMDYFEKKDEIFYQLSIQENTKFKGMNRVNTHLFEPVKKAMVEAAQVHDMKIEQLINNVCLYWLARNQDFIKMKKDEQRKKMEDAIKDII